MRSPRFGQLRYLRAAVFAAVIILVGTTAHVAGGGQLPTFMHGTVIFILVFWACVVLTRWRLPLPAVLAVLGAGEFALHEALMIAPTGAAGSAVGPMSGVAHHAMGGMGGMHAPMGGMHAPMAGMDAQLTHPVSMLAFHVIATALTALALSHGENAVWRLWTWLTATVVRPHRFRLTPLPSLGARIQAARPAACPILRVAPLRGPPPRQFSPA